MPILQKYKIYLITIVVSFVFFGVIAPATVSTQGSAPFEIIELTNPVEGTSENKKGNADIRVILGNVVAKALTVLGSITLAIFVIGGVFYLTSRGNQEQIKKGTDTMLWAVIGLLVIFSSYAMLNLLLGGLTNEGYGAANLEGKTFYKAKIQTELKSEPNNSATSRGDVNVGVGCIKSTGESEGEGGEKYIEVEDVPVGLPENQNGWIKRDHLEEMDDQSLCSGEGAKTQCEQAYADIRDCVDTTGYSESQKTTNCIEKKCSNQILFNRGDTKSLDEGNSWLCCLLDQTKFYKYTATGNIYLKEKAQKSGKDTDVQIKKHDDCLENTFEENSAKTWAQVKYKGVIGWIEKKNIEKSENPSCKPDQTSKVCDEKTCYYKLNSTSVSIYSDTTGTKISGATLKPKGTCFAIEGEEIEVSGKKDVFVKVKYKGEDAYMRVKGRKSVGASSGSVQKWLAKVTNKESQCKSYPADLLPLGTDMGAASGGGFVPSDLDSELTSSEVELSVLSCKNMG